MLRSFEPTFYGSANYWWKFSPPVDVVLTMVIWMMTSWIILLVLPRNHDQQLFRMIPPELVFRPSSSSYVSPRIWIRLSNRILNGKCFHRYFDFNMLSGFCKQNIVFQRFLSHRTFWHPLHTHVFFLSQNGVAFCIH